MIFHFFVVGAMAGATWTLGWWGVALVAFVAGAVYSARDGRARLVALCAAESWAIIFLFDAMNGPLGKVAITVASLVKLPAIVLLVVTLVFPALLAWSAAAFASELVRLLPGKTPAASAAP